MKSGSERLRLFDPAARAERFDPVTSDFDFVVRFADKSPGYASRYLDFAEALEELFGREVDLVTERSVQHPHFRRALESAQQLVYEREHEEAATRRTRGLPGDSAVHRRV
jgi:predicted nucleotidyltransferase